MWCKSHSYFPAIVPWWKLEYCACTVSPIQRAKLHSTERPPFIGPQRQRITSCARGKWHFIFHGTHFHTPFCSWSSLHAIRIIRDAECRHYTVMQAFVLPWHLVLFPHLFECDRRNLQNLLKFPSGLTWPALTGMANSAAAKQLQKGVSF